MNNPRLATRYAKSILDLSIEQNVLDDVYADMKMLQQLFKQNPDFVAMLRSPIIAGDKKDKIIAAVIGQKITKLSALFINLLTVKTRESNLPEIATAFIIQYNQLKKIQTVKITTAVSISDELKKSLMEKVQNSTTSTIELETAVQPELIGGFKMEIGNTLIDASILKDLNDVRKQFLNNEYIHNLR